MRRLANAEELLDGPLDPSTLRGNLRDLERVNRWLGGRSLSLNAVKGLARGVQHRTTVLDVGTGAGDIPLYMSRSTAYSDLGLEFEAIDIRPEIVAIARHTVRRHRVKVRLARLEAEPDGSFDVVHSSLLMHHLDPAQAIATLREMARVARRAVIVNDLDRTRRWLRLARLLARLLSTNRYTRHDAPLSVQRAYRPDELARLAKAAGLVEVSRLWTRPAYRYAITFVHA
jgi:2-polyprenyl-3-methyl-5-hydroxy-6-metoxy-1,4-benzoquinol methylase